MRQEDGQKYQICLCFPLHPFSLWSLSNETEWWRCSGGGVWRGRWVYPLGREEVIAAGLCLAMTLTGSDCVGPLGGQTLKEQKAG